MLDKAAYLTAIRESVPLLAAAARRDLRAPVPSCPGWVMATLVGHIAGVERSWAYIVDQRAQEPTEPDAGAFGAPPETMEWLDRAQDGEVDVDRIPNGLIPWFEESAAAMLKVFERTDPEEPIWHWSGDNRGITHFRNQAMEHTIHLWDAQNAVGDLSPIDPAIAADGIDQHFDVQLPAGRRWNEALPGSGESFHLHRTDGPGEWLVRFEDDGYTVTREHAKGDVAVRGSAADLFLWVFGRSAGAGLEVLGDRALFDRYHRLAPAL